ncbi:hypothetical protein D3C73_1371710 [compost metagenome]
MTVKKPLLNLIAGILFIIVAFLSGAYVLGNLIMKMLFDSYTDLLFVMLLAFVASIAASAYFLTQYSKKARKAG